LTIDEDVFLLDLFCDKHSLRWRISDEHEPIVLAPSGYLYCYDQANKLLAVCFYPDELSAECWQDYITTCLRAGMGIISDGLYKSYLSFVPTDEKQCALAIKICGVKRSGMTEAEREHLKIALARMRKRKAAQELAAQRAEYEWRWKMLVASL
jgi:hypothetical protein